MQFKKLLSGMLGTLLLLSGFTACDDGSSDSSSNNNFDDDTIHHSLSVTLLYKDTTTTSLTAASDFLSRETLVTEDIPDGILTEEKITELNALVSEYGLTFDTDKNGWYTDENLKTEAKAGVLKETTYGPSGGNFRHYEIYAKVNEDIGLLRSEYMFRDSTGLPKYSTRSNSLFKKETKLSEIQKVLMDSNKTIKSVDIWNKDKKAYDKWDEKSSLQGKDFYITLNETWEGLKDYFVTVEYSTNSANKDYTVIELKKKENINLQTILSSDYFATLDSNNITARKGKLVNDKPKYDTAIDPTTQIEPYSFVALYFGITNITIRAAGKNLNAEDYYLDTVFVSGSEMMSGTTFTEEYIAAWKEVVTDYGFTLDDTKSLMWIDSSSMSAPSTVSKNSTLTTSSSFIEIWVPVKEADVNTFETKVYTVDKTGFINPNSMPYLLHKKFETSDFDRIKLDSSLVMDAGVTLYSDKDCTTKVSTGDELWGKQVYAKSTASFDDAGIYFYYIHSGSPGGTDESGKTTIQWSSYSPDGTLIYDVRPEYKKPLPVSSFENTLPPGSEIKVWASKPTYIEDTGTIDEIQPRTEVWMVTIFNMPE